jgi:hypothetical protein
MYSSKNIIIFKNDAVGDLSQSLDAINNIIKHNKNNNILIYLSERSKNFSFFLNFNNVKIKIVKYDLTISQKIKIFLFLLMNSINSIYILTPKKFYFYLPLFFKKIKFYALCINSTKGYKRPSNFFRKFLYYYQINDRETFNKRKSTMELQRNLTKDLNYNEKFTLKNLPKFNLRNLKKIEIIDNYIYFHLKISNFKKLGWGYNELKMIFNEFLKFNKNIIFTRDIEKNIEDIDYKKDFNVINFLNGETVFNKSRIFLYDNLVGSDLYHIINNADKVIAFHGMMTNLATIENNPVLDLFHCEINSIADFRRYKNALYEFKPRYKGYDFIVPSTNIQKTIKKMRFSLRKI